MEPPCAFLSRKGTKDTYGRSLSLSRLSHSWADAGLGGRSNWPIIAQISHMKYFLLRSQSLCLPLMRNAMAMYMLRKRTLLHSLTLSLSWRLGFLATWRCPQPRLPHHQDSGGGQLLGG
jgi:hypothetical protein